LINRILLSGLFVLAFIIILNNNIPQAQATTVTWDGEGLTDNWSDADNWSTNSIPSQVDDIIIDSNNGVSSVIHLDIDYQPSGTITINSGDTLVIDSGKKVINFGTITNDGTFIVDGLFRNSGAIINQPSGNFEVKGVSTNRATGSITNFGTFTISTGSIINAGGTITNHNTMNIDGGIHNFVSGLIDNRGDIFNGGSIINVSEMIVNSGTINNEISGVILNGALIKNHMGTITNYGEITNSDTIQSFCGYISNEGTITNILVGDPPAGIQNWGGTIDNGGIIENKGNLMNLLAWDGCVGPRAGMFTNDGTINNDGIIENKGAGTIINTGTINNFVEIWNMETGTLNNLGTIINCPGEIHDFGIFTGNLITGTCNDTDGDGIEDRIDVEPNTFSDEFDDGTSFGRISRGDQIITIIVDPSGGIRVEADSSGGLTRATLTMCGFPFFLYLNAGDAIEVLCFSVTVNQITGTTDIILISNDGTIVETSLNEGNSLTYEPSTATLTASQSNTETVMVDIDGEMVSIHSGNTIVVPEFDAVVLVVLASAIAGIIIINKTSSDFKKLIQNYV